MREPVVDVIIIGAGQAGLGVSYYLELQGVRHVVLERGRIGETWRTQRWDSFRLNSPNRFNVLPGDTYAGSNPDGFDSALEFPAYLESYAGKHRLPVHEHARVLSVERNSSGFHVTASEQGRTKRYTCRQVVAASGAMNVKKVPSFSRNISSKVMQCHAGDYRNAAQLPDGAVLVVGSAQSGLQVAEDLMQAGRKVYLSTSAVGRVPRRYRGKDILDWLLTVGFYDMKPGDVRNPAELEMRPPQVSGVGPRGHTHSLQSLARNGAVILGRMDNAGPDAVSLQPNGADHVRFSDEVSARIKRLIDDFIQKRNLDAPAPEPDPADEPDARGECAWPVRSLNLDEHHVRSIVWTTGFSGDFGYLKNAGLDADGRPRHHEGVCDVEGLFCIGLPWLRKRKSSIVVGVGEDAEVIAGKISRRA